MTALPTPLVPVSWGELLDKLTILAIKRARIDDREALANIAREEQALAAAAGPAMADPATAPLVAELQRINAALWDIEDQLRRHEAAACFDAGFVELARAVYRLNDERAAAKRAVNRALGSELIEEKSYAAVTAAR